ncbi:MAG: porin [Sulfurimonas sp.]
MKNNSIFTLSTLMAMQLFALEDNGITIIDKNSPDFLLGKQTHINMKFTPSDAPEMWFKAGIRIQGTFESRNTEAYNTDGSVKSDTTTQDAFLRRVRLEVAAGFGKYASFTMDIRNDKANKGIENPEGSFNVGDAYVKIKKPFDTSLVNFKLYRAKIDISRTETVKSARVIVYDRPYIADAAAQYISFNRRGANAQMYGDWNKKVHYQIAVGSASSPDKILDAAGIKGSSASVELDQQSFFYGGKVILSPFDGWEETKRTETYFGEGKHFSVGASYWAIPTMKGTATIGANTALFDLNRELINIEASAHYKGLFLQGEYFKFQDVVQDWEVNGNVTTGSSDGWYVTGEYVFTDLKYIAPFARYESWDRFQGKDGYDVTSTLAGVNWYLRGNTTKVGLIYQKDEYGINTGNKHVTSMRVTSQWFF